MSRISESKTIHRFIIFLVVLICILTSVSLATAQGIERCTLMPAQVPELRGLRLGMSLDQVISIFPEIRNDPSFRYVDVEDRQIGFIQNIMVTPRNESKFDGIALFGFDFLDGRVSHLSVIYRDPSNGMIWRSVEEYAPKVSDVLGLPHKAWAKFRREDNELWMQCKGFSVQINALGNSSMISIKDSSADTTVRKRKAELEERKRKEFKP